MNFIIIIIKNVVTSVVLIFDWSEEVYFSLRTVCVLVCFFNIKIHNKRSEVVHQFLFTGKTVLNDRKLIDTTIVF